MKILATLTVLTLSLAPSFAGSGCHGEHIDQTAASCMPGTVWDEAAGTCVEAPSS
ncbi:MAG TPA: hypothetical protein PKA03_17070 [Tabrizicola sp.]|nr:hypothetical protein [Tabrizicola sp.]HMS96897.1 hypothetical protein [Tabrizicola sp.]